MTGALFDCYGHPVNVLVDPRQPQRLFDDYGRPHIVVRDASGLDLAAANTISVLARRGMWMPAFTYECVETWDTSSGFGWAFLNGRAMVTGTVPASSHISSGSLITNRGAGKEEYNWDKASIFHFFVTRKHEDAEVVARTQFKADSYPPSCEQLTDVGIGLEVRNLSLYGESYGIERGEVDLGRVLTNNEAAEVLIVHYPGEKIEWYIDDVLCGVQSDAGKIPSLTSYMTICNSIKNGAGGGVDARYYFSDFTLWHAA